MAKTENKKTKNYTLGEVTACTLMGTLEDRIALNALNNGSSEKIETGKEYHFTDLVQNEMHIENLDNGETVDTYLTKLYDKATGECFHSLSKGLGNFFFKLFTDCGNFEGARLTVIVDSVPLADGHRTATARVTGIEYPRDTQNNGVTIEGATAPTAPALKSAESDSDQASE